MAWCCSVRIWAVGVALIETLWAGIRVALWLAMHSVLKNAYSHVQDNTFLFISATSFLINVLMIISAVKTNDFLIMPYIALKPFMLIAKVAQVTQAVSFAGEFDPKLKLGVALRVVQLFITVMMVFIDVVFWFVAFSAYTHIANKRQLQKGPQKQDKNKTVN